MCEGYGSRLVSQLYVQSEAAYHGHDSDQTHLKPHAQDSIISNDWLTTLAVKLRGMLP